MSRLLKAVPLTLALAALSIFATSCASSNHAQMRVINAIPDSGPEDIYVNGLRIASSLPFGGVYPPPATSASYLSVAAGSDTIEGFAPGDKVDPIPPIATIPMNGLSQYTVIAIGLELNESPPLVLTDTNTAPTSEDDVEFRIINVSPSSPTGGVDVYIVPPGTNIADYTPQIFGLSFGQASAYQSVVSLANGYAVIFTPHLSKSILINQPATSQAESITTLVLMDNPGGNNGMSQTPLVLNDLN